LGVNKKEKNVKSSKKQKDRYGFLGGEETRTRRKKGKKSKVVKTCGIEGDKTPNYPGKREKRGLEPYYKTGH